MLPNATKTNYGNVDDITPSEQNNIGLNLISLGQKIQKVGDDVWVATNADYDGANWFRLDVSKAATAIKVGVDGTITQYKVAAGANPIVWAPIVPSPVRCSVRHSGDQVIANNVLTALAFDTEDFDTDTMHSTSVNNSRITANTAGTYLVIGQAQFANNGTGSREIQLKKNGAAPFSVFAPSGVPQGGFDTLINGSCIIDLAVNDYLELCAYQSSGGNLTVHGGQGSFFQVARLS